MVPFIGTIIGSEGGGAVELRRGEEGRLVELLAMAQEVVGSPTRRGSPARQRVKGVGGAWPDVLGQEARPGQNLRGERKINLRIDFQI
jgi:hypothetical protein